MLTFTQAYTRAANMTGISLTNTTDITILKQDLNQGLRLFKNAARRYWTRQEKVTDMQAGQQYYQMPADFVRATEVRVNSNGLNFPVVLVNSEHLWNKLNIIPAMTINLPTYAFVRGFNEIGLWPTPSAYTEGGLIVSYEPRLIDMYADDVTATTSSSTTTVTNGNQTVQFSNAIVLPQMTGQWFSTQDGTDGNWYQIADYLNPSAFLLANNYQGLTNSTVSAFTVGSAPDLPEDYHMALCYYAAFNFFLKRKDTATAEMYKNEFYGLLEEYKSTYSGKQTGLVQNAVQDYRYSLFSIPPNPIT
jgi:hypothetical protein